MIKVIINGIFSLVMALVDVILLPIDTLIESFLPDVANVLNYIGQFFNYVLQFIPYICSWFHFPGWFVSFVIAYYVFKLSVPLAIHTVKLAVKWYNSLKV